jgi:2'-5' RNA ligase
MPYGVQLDLDAHGQGAHNALADRLASVRDLELVRQIGDVHHLSLAIYEELPVELLATRVKAFAHTLAPIDIRIAHLGIFPGGVLFLGVVVTPGLLELHRHFHAEFSSFSRFCWQHYHLGDWVPHITIAMNAKRAALQKAVGMTLQHWNPSGARLDTLRLIELRPVRTLLHQAL